MPRRPFTEASLDREVFVEPLPGGAGSKELQDFLARFGKVVEVYPLYGLDAGYVVFAHHEAAAALVDDFGGGVLARADWSESERAIRWGEAGCAYPISLVAHLLGEDRDLRGYLQKLMGKTGVRNLRLHSGSGPDKLSCSTRVHFAGEGTSKQVSDLCIEIEGDVTNVHEHIRTLLESQPTPALDGALMAPLASAEVEQVEANEPDELTTGHSGNFSRVMPTSGPGPKASPPPRPKPSAARPSSASSVKPTRAVGH